MSTNSH